VADFGVCYQNAIRGNFATSPWLTSIGVLWHLSHNCVMPYSYCCSLVPLHATLSVAVHAFKVQRFCIPAHAPSLPLHASVSLQLPASTSLKSQYSHSALSRSFSSSSSMPSTSKPLPSSHDASSLHSVNSLSSTSKPESWGPASSRRSSRLNAITQHAKTPAGCSAFI